MKNVKSKWLGLLLVVLLAGAIVVLAAPPSGIGRVPANKSTVYDKAGARYDPFRETKKPAPKKDEKPSSKKAPKDSGKEQPAADPAVPVKEPAGPYDPSKEGYAEWAFGRFMDYYEQGIAEKLYIQTDKPYYSAGDTLWFKGYVVNAITLTPSPQSHYIYVELIGRGDSLAHRMKVMADDYGFHNCIPLPNTLPEGDYCLRGYTSWMRNDGSDHFFRKIVKVGNPIDDAIRESVAYVREGNEVIAEIQITGSSQLPVTNQRFSYTIDTDGRSRTYNVRTDADGRMRIPFTAPAADSAQYTIALTTDYNARRITRQIFLPSFSDDFDVQFFPEGGRLLPGELQNVAFKAVGTDGLAREVRGRVVGGDGATITEFTTTHLGMGLFGLIPVAGGQYTAEVTSGDVTKRFALPGTEASGCALKVILAREKILYQIFATPDIDVSKLAVVIQSRGRIVAAEEIAADKLSKSLSVDRVPSGITQIAVVEKATGRVISQRLVFVNGRDRAAAVTHTDRKVYERRSPVALDLTVRGSDGQPAAGLFAVSVTDRNAVKPDTLGGNICSYLLAASDLRGHIESPGSYFDGGRGGSDERLNLLMMTQGWSRFDISDVLAGITRTREYPYEPSQAIAGEVRGFFGNAARNPYIVLFAPKSGFMETFQLTGNKFNFVGLEFPDSTQFILQALARGGSNRTVTLKVKGETFPVPEVFIPKPLPTTASFLPESFLRQSKERYYYEGGMRVVDIEGVAVTARRSESATTLYNAVPNHSVHADMLSRFTDIYSALRMLPGVRVNGTEVSVRNSSDPPMVYVDNMEIDAEMLGDIDVSQVERIDLVTGGEASIFGFGASGGVIILTLKSGAALGSARLAVPSLVVVKPLGYTPPVDFYQPKYHLRNVRESNRPDLRTTLHWDPKIHTDSTGVAKLSFYTSDHSGLYDVTVEGITDRGEVCRYTTTVECNGQ